MEREREMIYSLSSTIEVSLLLGLLFLDELDRLCWTTTW